MKIIRHLTSDGPAYAALQPDGSARNLTGDFTTGFHLTDTVVTPGPLLPPVEPATLYCIGLNYRLHADQLGRIPQSYPLIFIKSNHCIHPPGAPIEIPITLPSDAVDYEGELAVVIGRTAKNVPREEALDYVFGYTIANDVSARDWQFQLGGGQFCQAKSFDTFCPLGPVLITPDELPLSLDLRLRTTVNGELRQDGRTGDMLFDVPSLIAFLSASKTLLPGTVILTGSPGGTGHSLQPPVYLKNGDIVRVEIEGIGTLENPVTLEIPSLLPQHVHR